MERKPASLKYLSRRQVQTLLEGPHRLGEERDFYLLALLYFGALRASEVTLLRPAYLRVDYGELLVPSAKKKRAAPGEGIEPSTGRPLVPIPILHGQEIFAAAKDWAGERALLFPSPSSDEKPLSTRQVRFTFRRWANVAKIDKRVSAHSLRHSAGSHIQDALNAAGFEADVVLVRDFMRHSNVAVTSTYLHSTPAKIRRAREAMAKYRE